MKFSPLSRTAALRQDAATHSDHRVRAPVQAQAAQIALFGRKSALKYLFSEILVEAAASVADYQSYHRLIFDGFRGCRQFNSTRVRLASLNRLVRIEYQVTKNLQQADAVSAYGVMVYTIRQSQFDLGESVGEDQQLISTERLELSGFFDEAVGLKVLQGGAQGLLASTVIDFRVGRILGVAFVGTLGDHGRLDLAAQLALALEKRIVRVVLGG